MNPSRFIETDKLKEMFEDWYRVDGWFFSSGTKEDAYQHFKAGWNVHMMYYNGEDV